MTATTKKQRLEQAYDIHASVHMWMGYLVCDGEEDLLSFRRWVLKQKREERNKIKKIIKELRVIHIVKGKELSQDDLFTITLFCRDYKLELLKRLK